MFPRGLNRLEVWSQPQCHVYEDVLLSLRHRTDRADTDSDFVDLNNYIFLGEISDLIYSTFLS